MSQQMLSYEKASKWAKKNKIKDYRHWQALALTNKLPKNIPHNPDSYYKIEHEPIIKILNYNQAKEEMKKYPQIHSSHTYGRWKDRPKYLPKVPHSYYKKWKGKAKGWQDFLGKNYYNGNVGNYVSFEEARKAVKEIGIVSKTEHQWVKSWFPEMLPRHPDDVYAKKWKGWGYYLGTFYVAHSQRKYWSYQKCTNWLKKNKIKSAITYYKFVRQNKFPKGIPKEPRDVFKVKGKIFHFQDYLAINNRKKSDKNHWRTYKQAKKWAKKSGIISLRDWKKASMKNIVPENIPAQPEKVYEKDWQGYGTFLGTGVIATNSRTFFSYNKSKKIMRKLKIKDNYDFRQRRTDRTIPEGVPSNPNKIYVNKGWKDWEDFLGNKKHYLSYEKASEWVKNNNITSQKQFHKARQQGKLPYFIPTNPAGYYTRKNGEKIY